MTTRSERYEFEQDASKSRVARNQELYEQIYASDSYFQNDDKPSNIERTNEIDIEKVKELLKGREIYRREMKMREINMGNPENTDEEVQKDDLEEKNYDINAYLDKASSDRVVEPYHKIDPEILAEPEEEEEKKEEPSLEELKEMGTTALSLEMFSDLSSTSELEDTDEYEEDEEEEEESTSELVATITETNAFFTDSVKLAIDDDEEDEDDEEKASPVLKIVMILLILIIVGLVVYLILM